MESITSLNQELRMLFFEAAPRFAKEQNLIKRQRCFSATSLLLVLVLGWLQHPLAGPSQLARFAVTVGVSVKKQAIAERLTEQTPSGFAIYLRPLSQRSCVLPSYLLR